MELSASAPVPPHPAPTQLDAEALAAAGGDRDAFERLYRGTVARVHSLARRLVGRARADEATQEIYLRAWSALPRWRGEGPIGAWLQRLARNALINALARRGLEPRSADAARDLLEEHAAPGAGTGTRIELEEAIEALPPGARAVFVLHDVEGFLHEEIATRLGCSVGTSKSQLHRARLLLRAALSPGETP